LTISQFCGSLSGFISRSDVTSAARAGSDVVTSSVDSRAAVDGILLKLIVSSRSLFDLVVIEIAHG
jgi:hypothetical protein